MWRNRLTNWHRAAPDLVGFVYSKRTLLLFQHAGMGARDFLGRVAGRTLCASHFLVVNQKRFKAVMLFLDLFVSVEQIGH